MRRNRFLLWGTILVVAAALAGTIAVGNRPVLGLDLQGGISLRLIPVGDKGTDWDSDGLDQAVDIIRQRVDALGVAEPEISREGDTIVVELPGVKDRDKAEALVGQTAELRFRPVEGAIPGDQFDDQGNFTATTTTAPAESTTTTAPAGDQGDAGQGGGDTTTTAAETTTTTEAPTTTTTAPATTTTTGQGAATDGGAADQPCPEIDPNAPSITDRADDRADCTVVLPDRDGQLVYVLGPAVLTGEIIDTASARYDPSGQVTGGAGPRFVEVQFTSDGGGQFVQEIATPYVNKQVAIVLDGIVQSAPTINPGITGDNVVITGDFSESEASDLATVLRFGALPVVLEQEAAVEVSPTLGSDQLAAGVIAGLIGLGLVALFMVWYYRILGLVVVGGLMIVAGAMWALVSYLAQSIGLALTLAGVTGLIVSVGVTVDSYIVYFERLKDEVRTGKTIRSAVERGFARSFRTIVTADTVSLIGAALLYWLAIGAVKGFALFLFLSTALDLVISYTFMHPLVAIIARTPRLVSARWFGLAAALRATDARR